MLMRRRLYFVLPDIQSARTMLNDMLLARIECRHIHFLSKRDSLPSDLPGQVFCRKPISFMVRNSVSSSALWSVRWPASARAVPT